MRRVAIAYGFSEGPAKAARLARALAAHGYQLTSMDRADVIITHSGGCHMVPQGVTPQLIWIIAPTVGPATRTPLRTQMRKMRRDVRRLGLWRVIARNSLNLWYLLSRLPYNLRMALTIKQAVHIPTYSGRQVVSLCHGDPWSETFLPQDVADHPQVIFMTLYDNHDDLWYEPEKYLKTLHGIYGQYIK